jgi:hypothetical protein
VNTEDLPLCLVPHTSPGPLTSSNSSSGSSTAEGGEAAQQQAWFCQQRAWFCHSGICWGIRAGGKSRMLQQLWLCLELLPSHAGEHGGLATLLGAPHITRTPDKQQQQQQQCTGGARQQASSVSTVVSCC